MGRGPQVDFCPGPPNFSERPWVYSTKISYDLVILCHHYSGNFQLALAMHSGKMYMPPSFP